jgi:delta-1-pyrroline-5-carboxylate synthetase
MKRVASSWAFVACSPQSWQLLASIPVRLRHQSGSPPYLGLITTDSYLFAWQVGTAVVTRHDGRLALGRLGALCEQVLILPNFRLF